MIGTARLQLPLLSAGQAQKEVTVNEALQELDIFTAGAVEEGPRQDPPASPAIGSCYVMGSAPTGEWVGKPGYVAAFTSGGWRLYPPIDGARILQQGRQRVDRLPRRLLGAGDPAGSEFSFWEDARSSDPGSRNHGPCSRIGRRCGSPFSDHPDPHSHATARSDSHIIKHMCCSSLLITPQ